MQNANQCKTDAKLKKIFKFVPDENTFNFLFGLHFWFAFCVLHCKIKWVGEIKKISNFANLMQNAKQMQNICKTEENL